MAMLSPDKILELATPHTSFLAKRVLEIRHLPEKQAYVVKFGSTEGELLVEVFINSQNGDYISSTHYGLIIPTYERAVLDKLQTSIEKEEAIKRLLLDGRRLDAMKAWREYFKGSLRDAKKAIEELSKELD